MDTEFKKELANKRRLQELLVSIRNEAEEASCLMSRLPEADEQVIAVLDRVMRVLNEC